MSQRSLQRQSKLVEQLNCSRASQFGLVLLQQHSTGIVDGWCVDLQMVSEMLVRKGSRFQVAGCLFSPEPCPALPLGVNQKGVASSASHEDAVLYAQLICW